MYARHDDTFTPTYAAPARKGVLQTFAAWLERRKQAQAESRAITTLASLDAHLLRDIGASTADIERLVRDGRL